MNTSNKNAKDPLDRLVHESDVKAKHVVIDRDLDLMLVVLNSGGILRLKLSDQPKLKKASKAKLNDWRLIANGIGIHWNQLDEDLSIKGMIQQAAMNNAIREITGGNQKAVA
jgi:hypothetical protein